MVANEEVPQPLLLVFDGELDGQIREDDFLVPVDDEGSKESGAVNVHGDCHDVFGGDAVGVAKVADAR